MGSTLVCCARALLVVAVSLLVIAPVSGEVTTLTFDRLHWYDRVGNPHRIQGVNIEFFEDDSWTDDENLGTLAVGSGNAAGYLQLTTTEWEVLDDELEVYAKIHSEIPGVGKAGGGFNNSEIVKFKTRMEWAGNNIWSVPEGGSLTLPENPAQTLSIPGSSAAGNITDASRVTGTLQSFMFAHNYFDSLGASIPTVEILFNRGLVSSEAWANGYRITVGSVMWGSWDTNFHEFGHIVALNNELDDQNNIYGLGHAWGVDNIGFHGVDEGTRLAWTEGIATYLGLSSVKDGDLNTFIRGGDATDGGLPAADLDERYNQYLSGNRSLTLENDMVGWVSIESQEAWVEDENGRGTSVGEGDESSVMRILWDLYDTDDTGAEPIAFAEADHNDRWALGAQTVFDTMRADGDQMDGRLTDLWENVQLEHALVPKRAAELGELFQEYGVSAVPGLGVGGGVADDSATTDTTPLLVWSEQNSLHSEFFKVAIFDKLFTELILESPQLQDVTEWTVPDGSELAVGDYNWVVISNSVMQDAIDFYYNMDDNTVLSPSYWSGAVQFRITAVPEPAALLLAVMGLTLLLRRRQA